MSTFTLKQDGFKDYTSIPNCFIEKFMPKAAGEFVKIYIYILKCLEENRAELSISRIADVFNDTEKDIIRALKYWQKKGLLTLSFDGDVLTSLKVNHLPDDDAGERKIVKEGTEPQKAREYTREELDAFSEKEDIPLLLYSIQKYLGRPLTNSDLGKILFFYDELKFSPELVEYLFEYCISNNHRNMRYIEKTAIAWKEQNISTPTEAKRLSQVYSDESYQVLREFGLTGRAPTQDEANFVSRWTLSYGFEMPMVVEACRKTMNAIHKPSFEYTDSILSNWKSAGITTLEMVKASDRKFEQKTSVSRKKTSSKAKNEFNSFDQRSYDWDELEAELFNLK